MSNHENNEEKVPKEQDVHLEKEVDQEALDVIFRLYDKTFRDLVER
ncbi:MAG: hypothetical protein ABF649_03305 [Bacillus sp. (in: firmicutes)]